MLIIHLCFSQAWDPESLFLCEDFSCPSSSLIPPLNFQVQPQRSLKSFHSELLLRVKAPRPLGASPVLPSPSCSLALSSPEPACQPPLSAPFPSGESLALTCWSLMSSSSSPPAVDDGLLRRLTVLRSFLLLCPVLTFRLPWGGHENGGNLFALVGIRSHLILCFDRFDSWFVPPGLCWRE